MQALRHELDGLAPRPFEVRVREQRIEGEVRALESHRHAVAREGRDHGVGVAEPDPAGWRGRADEIDRRYCAE